MGKRFKLLRIPSFHCCRSNDISVVPTDPPSPSPPPKPHHSSFRRHVSSAFRTAACACRSSSTNSDDDDDQISKPSPNLPTHVPPTPLLHSYDDVSDFPNRPRQRRKKKSKSTTLTRLRTSTSSASAESGLFSSESFDEIDELEETETLISSSKTISGDSSSEFNSQLETIREKPYKTRNKINLRTKKEKEKRRRSSNRRQKQKRTMIKTSPSPELESPARLSVFQRLIPCRVEGKIRESFAVVKKSADPFEDFKRSMMEMIMEKEMFDGKDLEQLLHCLLSLNDREHHGIIVEAFSEIWQSLFSN